MARYIDEILQPGEKVLFSSSVHWIVHLPGLLCWGIVAASLVGAVAVQSETQRLMLLSIATIAALAGLYLTLRAWFRRWTTETDVTNLRIVHKTGFITRKTFEISVDKVASVNVDQSVPGRIFNYGDVRIESMGEIDEPIRMIARPLAFRSHITAR